MTWKDIKIAVLQKIFAINGAELVENDETYSYLAAMPYACNEALALLSITGGPVTAATPDEYEFDAPNEAVVLIPLYIASQIYKDDDAGLAGIYRNEFEIGREEYKTSQVDDPESDDPGGITSGSGKIVKLGGMS